MKRNISISSLFIVLAFGTIMGQTELEKKLFGLEDVIFKQIDSPEGFESAYELMVRQPLDHEHPSMGHFYQKVYLSHRDFSAPAVLVTEGYNRPSNRIYELSDYLSANQVQVEHRFFGESAPDSLDYRYLNLSQATSDLHRIRDLLGNIYEGPWISTGISKGGMTTLFYRYFYPDDVQASVPYVAPINLDLKDDRIYTFLEGVGTAECRKKIEAFQKAVLKQKDDILPRARWFARGQEIEFERLGLEGAFELAVLEYSFSFWQFGHDCDRIPSPSAPVDSLLSHLLKVSGLDFFSDATLEYYAPFYYQMGTEMGYYGFQTHKFENWLEVVGNEPSAVFMPEGAEAQFQGDLTRQAYEWFVHEADRVVYINGGIDTWSATAVLPNPALDAVLISMPGADHRSARIANMTADQAERLELALERWLDLAIDKRPEDLKREY